MTQIRMTTKHAQGTNISRSNRRVAHTTLTLTTIEGVDISRSCSLFSGFPHPTHVYESRPIADYALSAPTAVINMQPYDFAQQAAVTAVA